MKKIKDIFVEYDYDLFKRPAGNRSISFPHVAKLKKSFQEQYLLSPIIVNSQFEIIDGQHRFEAAKQLSLPVYFFICEDYSIDHIKRLNTNSVNWTKKDYLNAYCELDYPEYLKMRSFLSRFPEIQITSALSILSGKKQERQKRVEGHSVHAKDFENGNLKVFNYEKSILIAEKLMMFKPYYSGFNKRGFVSAMIDIFKTTGYIHETMIHKCRNNKTALVDCANVKQYKDMLESVYNHRNKNKLSFREL